MVAHSNYLCHFASATPPSGRNSTSAILDRKKQLKLTNGWNCKNTSIENLKQTMIGHSNDCLSKTAKIIVKTSHQFASICNEHYNNYYLITIIIIGKWHLEKTKIIDPVGNGSWINTKPYKRSSLSFANKIQSAYRWITTTKFPRTIVKFTDKTFIIIQSSVLWGLFVIMYRSCVEPLRPMANGELMFSAC